MESEMRYTVKQLAGLAGVSARTLHYYDKIGLLRPERNPDNGYRVYDRTAALRLQQVMFLRELGLSLEEIQEILGRPDFDLLSALEQHRLALQSRQERLRTLMNTVERTISYLKGSINMEGKQLFQGFSDEQQKEYEKEAAQRWGDTNVKESQKRWGSYPAEKKQQIADEGNAVYRDIVAAMTFGPESAQVQACIARWHQHLRYFYEPTKEVLLSLGDLYNDDPAFNANFNKIHPELAGFMRQAIQAYVKKM
jgi:MerR family transcriptional regulator, thiopeptide resistance regulator